MTTTSRTAPRTLWIFVQALLLCLMMVYVTATAADASSHRKKDRCSAEGQAPCPAHYKGPRCDVGLGNFGGTCRKCGGEGMRACPRSAKGKQCFDKRMKIDGRCYKKCGGPNQKACNKAKRGYPCKGNYEPNSSGFCKPCGGPGQTACRALKAGKQCHSGTAKFGKKCERCGGLNQRACPTLKAGKRCNGNLANIDGKCQRCGGLNQKACPVLKAGKQCGSGLTKIKGYCKQCGGPNQQACPKLASGYPCKGKYEPNQYNICKPCGGSGQKPCRAFKAGKQCNSGLHKINKICQACGQRGQIACPKVYAGYPCKGKLEPDQNKICQPCGRANQKACRALKAGKRCEAGTANIKGYCITCGGPDQAACPKLASGYPCRGKYEPNDKGICKPCGGTGQTACRVLKAGRQCEAGSTERGGVCVTCGGEGQRACKITDKGKACADGLKRGLNGICKITPAGETKKRALADLKTLGKDVMPLFGMSTNLGQNKSLQKSVHNAETGEGESNPEAEIDLGPVCLGGRFGTVTVGIGGEVGAGLNFEGETGVAFRCGKHKDAAGNKPDEGNTKLYSSGSINWRLGGGGTVAFTAGLWTDDFNQLRGLSHGYVLDIRDAISSGLAIKHKDITKKVQKFKKAKSVAGTLWANSTIDVSIGMWYERLDEDGDGKANEVGRFLGFTVSVGPSVGLDVGGAYIRAKTVQKCDEFMKCAEGFWTGDGKIVHITAQDDDSFMASVDDGTPTEFSKNSYRKYSDAGVATYKFRKNFTVLKYEPESGSKIKMRRIKPPSAEGIWASTGSDGTRISIDEQVKNRTKVRRGRDTVEEYLFAAINGGPRERFDRTFGRTWKDSDGDKIKFRKNWTKLKYEPQDGNKIELEKTNLEAPSPSETIAINTLGLWDFHVNRRTHTEEIVSQDDDKIVVRRLDTDLERTYNKVEDNKYQSDHDGGGTFRFVSETRALWISADERTIFQLNKRE